LLTARWKREFPRTDVEEANAAPGGTESWLGATRAKQDAIAKKPDLGIVEFAANGGGSPEKQVYASMEGIFRQIRAGGSEEGPPVRLRVGSGPEGRLQKGRLARNHAAAREDRRAVRHPEREHGAVRRPQGQGESLTFEEFAKDGVRPTERATFPEPRSPSRSRETAAAISTRSGRIPATWSSPSTAESGSRISIRGRNPASARATTFSRPASIPPGPAS
jgi:hypothetical protein